MSAKTTFLLPDFDKNIPNKVNENVEVKSRRVLSNKAGAGNHSAIATSGFSSKTDGVYVFATKIDNIGNSDLLVGFTDVKTYDSKKSGFLCGDFFGTGLSCYYGERWPGSVPYLSGNITEKAKEIISILTISNNGGKKEIMWIVDGNEGAVVDCTKDLGKGDEIFPCISFGYSGQQVELIPFDQVKSRCPKIEKFLKEYSPSTNQSKGAAANNNNNNNTSSPALAQLQQELEKERQRAYLLETQLRDARNNVTSLTTQLQQERQNSASKDAEIERLRLQLQQKDQQFQQQLETEKKNSTSLAHQLNLEKQNSFSLIQQKDQLIAQLQQENKNLLQEISALKKDSDLGATTSLPAARCFDMALSSLPDVKESLRQLLALREVPPGRPDLQAHIPTDQNVTNILNILDFHVDAIKQRDAVKQLIASCNLTDDNVRALFLYGAEHPYCVYRWLNGWLTGSRRDIKVQQAVGPFFNHLYRAMEKLPKVESRAARAVKVNNIPSLVAIYDHHVTRLAAGQRLSFWGVSSFSTNDAVINDPMFCGQPHEAGIIYMCGELVGVDMEPFKPDGMPCEDEILPMCPAVFEVQAAVMAGKKLVISLKQTDHDRFSYVEPSTK